MENFFVDDKFYSEICELLDDLEIDEENVNDLNDCWEIECIETKLEPIFVLDEKYIIDSIIENTDKWEDRFPEYSDIIVHRIKSAIKQSVDIEKINNLLPKLYYPTGNKFKIVKKDLLEYLKIKT